MLNLKNVTALTVYSMFDNKFDRTLFDQTINAMKRSMSGITFGQNVLLTSEIIKQTFENELNNIGIKCDTLKYEINNFNDYSRYMVYELNEHVENDYVLTIQHDGFVINPNSWTDDFLNYDYIGAPWPVRDNAYISPFNEHIRVGNGGFSLRSKKLLEVPSKIDIPFDCTTGSFYKHFDQNNFNEDGCIAVHNRHLFESQGCKFAPVDLAVKFSQELDVPEAVGIVPFGFHKLIPRWSE